MPATIDTTGAITQFKPALAGVSAVEEILSGALSPKKAAVAGSLAVTLVSHGAISPRKAAVSGTAHTLETSSGALVPRKASVHGLALTFPQIIEEFGEPEIAPGVNNQTGTSYTYRHGDRERLVLRSNSGAMSDTLPAATGAFGSGFRLEVENLGPGTLTITPASGTINGAGTLVLISGQGATLESGRGTTWGGNWLAVQAAAGVQGIQGVKGDTGATGPAGPAGPGILALQSTGASAGAGPFTSGVELQVANPFVNFPTAVLNATDRRMITRFTGYFTTVGGETPTVDLSLEMSGTDIATITTGALTAGVASGKFFLSFDTFVLTTGASAILQTTGKLEIQLDGTTYTTYHLAATQTAAAIDITGTGKPKLNATCHGTALNAINLYDSFAEFLPAIIP